VRKREINFGASAMAARGAGFIFGAGQSSAG
jgi:hypothetical protein